MTSGAHDPLYPALVRYAKGVEVVVDAVESVAGRPIAGRVRQELVARGQALADLERAAETPAPEAERTLMATLLGFTRGLTGSGGAGDG